MDTGIYAHYRRLGMLPAILGGALPQPMNAPPGPSMGPQPIMGGNARNPALGAVPFPGQQWKSAGPLAVPQALPPPKGRGFLGAIDDVFGGPDMKNLTPEQQKAARRRGLLAFGAQMLTATDPRGNRAQGLSALGQGVMAAQGGYGQGIEQGMAQNQAMADQAMWAQLAPQPNETPDQTRARLQMVLSRAIQTGNTKVVTAVSEVLKSLSPKEGQQARLDQVRAGGKVRLVNPFTGETVREYDDPDAPRGLSPVQEMMQEQRRFGREVRLENDYMDETDKPYNVYDMIDKSLGNAAEARAGNGAAQVNMMYAFVKVMDMDSAVRDGELKLLQGASSVRQQIEALQKKYGSLEAAVIPPSMVAQVEAILKQGATRYEKRLQDAYGRYTERAKRYEVDPSVFRPAPSRYYIPPGDAAKKYGGPK